MNKIRIFAIFVMMAMLVILASLSPAHAVGNTVTLQESTATISQPQNGLFVYEAVDGITDGSYGGYNGWATFNGSSEAQTAVWETSSDVNASLLSFTLYHTWAASHALGRFRLSYTTDDRSLFADGLTENGDVDANWTVLTGAAVSSSCDCGDTFTVLGDGSILVGGTNPATNIYYVSFEGSFNGITGIRLEALTDPSLPTDGPGRGGNGNWHLVEITLDVTPPSPLDGAGWELVAHMSESSGLFDGNGELAPDYSYGTFNSNPVPSTPDFQRAFPVVADKILFITGDRSIWAIADYGDLRALIDARAGVFSPNIAFETGVNGVISNTAGNVLSRAGVNEDPWISMDGDHSSGIVNQRIVWGEINYSGAHEALKNSHGGINVYIKAVNDSDGDGVPDDQDAFPNDPDRTVSCLAGYYGATSCTPAPLGSYVATAGALTADLCPKGTFSDQLASIACTPAPTGTFVDFAGAAEATACAPGYFQDLEGQTSCSAAPIGFYVPDSGSASATACPSGSTTASMASTSLSDCNYPPTADAGGPFLVAVGEQTNFMAGPNTNDPDGDELTETWTADGGTVSGNTYTAGAVASIYDVQLVVNDGTVNSEPDTTIVVVYDPDGGFVTGGGWIMSPELACRFEDCADDTTGKANFGFVSKYKRGATTPTGQTEFQFKAGGLDFHSSSYEWLVVTGADQAKYKGVGTINGGGNYGFMLTAADDETNGDTFRIKIWDKDNGDTVVYDNQMDTDENEYNGTEIGGGNIKVHKK